MDPQKYSELRRQVVQVMNRHSSRRPNRCRRKSCPSLLIPSYFTKAVAELDKDHFKEIEEYNGQASPKKKSRRKPRAVTDKGSIRKELEKVGKIQKEVEICLRGKAVMK